MVKKLMLGVENVFFYVFVGLRMLHTTEIWTLGPDATLFAQKIDKITMAFQ